jgi:hypothetical protein
MVTQYEMTLTEALSDPLILLVAKADGWSAAEFRGKMTETARRLTRPTGRSFAGSTPVGLRPRTTQPGHQLRKLTGLCGKAVAGCSRFFGHSCFLRAMAHCVHGRDDLLEADRLLSRRFGDRVDVTVDFLGLPRTGPLQAA